MTSSIELTRALDHADTVARVAAARSYPMPEQWRAASAVAAEARQLAAEPAPTPPAELPAPGKAAQWVTKHGGAEDAWRTRTTTAQHLHDRAVRDAARHALSVAADVTNTLVTDVNTTTVPRFTDLLATAPRELSGHEDAETLAAHAELLRTVGALSLAAADRAALAVTLDEGADLGAAGAVFLLIDPPDTTTLTAITAAVTTIGNALPTTLEQWTALAHVGLAFARPGEAATRLHRYSTAQHRAAHTTPDRGLADHTLGEMTSSLSAA